MSQSRQLAAIMFTDIVGYTALMGEDEEKAFELLKKNRSVQRPIIERYNGRWLKEIGDGVLASFSTVSDAVYCAKEIQDICLKENDLKLRIGIHEGEVVFEGDDVFGEGVNIASRLEPLAPIGGILVSEAVYNNIHNKTGIESSYAGEKLLKNVKKPVKVYQIKVQGLEPMISEPGSYSKESSANKSAVSRKLLFASAGVVAILLLSYFLYTNLGAEQVEIHEKSIGVMPFRNDSNDPQNIYFCNGMMEDVISQLSKVEGMRVPSVTSMLYYRENPKPYDEIVEELNVSHLLEGSVRKLEDRILMNVTLIDAQKNEQIWTNRYTMDFSVEEVWDIQFKVAQQIIGSLKLALSPNKNYDLGDLPTESYEAYDNFLQARELLRNWSVEDNRQAIRLLRQAIVLDPDFYLGLSELAIALSMKTDMTGEPGVDSARFFAEKSLESKPDNAPALAAIGYFLGMTGDPKQAFEFYKRAVEKNPMVTYNFMGWCHWQLGKYEEAMEEYFQIFKNDPNNPINYIDLANVTQSIGLFDESVAMYNKALELSPNIMWVREGLGKAEYYGENFQMALSYFSMASSFGSDNMWMALNYIKLGDIKRARSHINKSLLSEDTPLEGASDKLVYYTIEALNAHLKLLEGDTTQGRTLMHQVIDKLNKELSDDYPPKFAALGSCYASLGMVKECVNQLKLGTGAWFHYYFLKQLPLFDPIRQDPVFQETMNQIRVKNTQMQQRVLSKGYFDEIMK